MIIFVIVLVTVLITILLCPLYFYISLQDGSFRTKLKFLIFDFDFNNSLKKKHKSKNIKTKKNKRSEIKNRNKTVFNFYKKIKNYKQVFIILLLVIKKFLLSMSRLNLDIAVMAQDSAKVGVRYGQICSAVSILLKIIFENRTKNKTIKIKPDFSCESSDGIALNCEFSVNLLNIVKCLMFLIREVLKRGVLNNV